MRQQRTLFARTVAGLLVFGVVTIGLRAASHEINRAASVTVGTFTRGDYTLSVSETAVNPSDRMNSLGIHADGYKYDCDLAFKGHVISTYTIRRALGFHGQQITISPLSLKNQHRIMVEVEIVPDSGATVVADCIVSPPASDDRYGGGIVDWRAFEIAGV